MLRIVLGLFALGGSLHADEPFTIDLKVSAGVDSKTVNGESASRFAKPKGREILSVKAGTRVTVHWKLALTNPKETLKEVTIHFYAARAEKIDQSSLAKLDKNVLAESALSMDFTPKESNEGELHFVIPSSGLYLLRLETIGAAAGPTGHEEFAALMVKVP